MDIGVDEHSGLLVLFISFAVACQRYEHSIKQMCVYSLRIHNTNILMFFIDIFLNFYNIYLCIPIYYY